MTNQSNVSFIETITDIKKKNQKKNVIFPVVTKK